MKHFPYVVTMIVLTIAMAGCNKPASVVGPSGGTTSSGKWTEVTGLPTFYNVIAVGTNLYAAGNTSVFRSTDDGNTWAAVDTTLPSGGYTIAVSGKNLIVGDYYGGNGVFISSDSGATWAASDSGLETSFDSVYQRVISMAADGQNIFLGTSSNGIFRSTDGGKSWKAANSGVSYGTSVYTLTFAGSNVLAGSRNGIYLSTDNGVTWSASDSGLVNLSPSYAGLPFVVSLSAKGSKVYAGAVGAQVYLSGNGGLGWLDISRSLPGSAQSGISLAISDSSLIVVDDNGAFVTRDDGLNWMNASDNLPNSGIYSFGEANGIAFVQLNDGSVWRLALSSI